MLISFSLMFLFASMGLAVDLGWAYFLKLRVQTAADSAAVAAAVYASNHNDSCGGTITCGVTYTCAGVSPPTNSLQAGCLYATTDGPPTMSATMTENNTVPPGVTGNTPSMWIQAVASTAAPNLFFTWSGFSSATISASAISGVSTLAAGACIYLLDPNAADAFSITGTSTLTTTGCGVYVNSSNAAAFYMYGSPKVTANSILVNGGTSISASSTVSPTPTTHAGTIYDPLANLAMPSVGTCNNLTTNGNGYSIGHSGTATLDAGVYCGGISITGSAVVTFSGGNYILNGGGLTVGNSAQVNTSAGSTFFNTAQSGYVAGPIAIGGNATATLSAPTSGTYKGILFYQDRNVSYSSPNTFSNSATTVMTGTFYFPTTAVTYTGNVSAAPVYEAFIAATMSITGSSTFKNDTSGNYTGLATNINGLIQ